MRILPIILIIILTANVAFGSLDLMLHSSFDSCHEVETLTKTLDNNDYSQAQHSCCEKSKSQDQGDDEKDKCCGEDCDCTCCHHHISQVTRLIDPYHLHELHQLVIDRAQFFYKDKLGYLHKYAELHPPQAI